MRHTKRVPVLAALLQRYCRINVNVSVALHTACFITISLLSNRTQLLCNYSVDCFIICDMQYNYSRQIKKYEIEKVK